MTASGSCQEFVEALAHASSVDEIHEICLRIYAHIGLDHSTRFPISLLRPYVYYRNGYCDVCNEHFSGRDRAELVPYIRHCRKHPGSSHWKWSELTDREKECLYWAAEGKTSWETAKILQISKRTVVFHLQNASRKLNAANRQNAIARAVVLGLITPEVS